MRRLPAWPSPAQGGAPRTQAVLAQKEHRVSERTLERLNTQNTPCSSSATAGRDAHRGQGSLGDSG